MLSMKKHNWQANGFKLLLSLTITHFSEYVGSEIEESGAFGAEVKWPAPVAYPRGDHRTMALFLLGSQSIAHTGKMTGSSAITGMGSKF